MTEFQTDLPRLNVPDDEPLTGSDVANYLRRLDAWLGGRFGVVRFEGWVPLPRANYTFWLGAAGDR